MQYLTSAALDGEEADSTSEDTEKDHAAEGFITTHSAADNLPEAPRWDWLHQVPGSNQGQSSCHIAPRFRV